MGTIVRPARNIPKKATTHSTELGSIKATASPFDNPKLRMFLAVVLMTVMMN